MTVDCSLVAMAIEGDRDAFSKIYSSIYGDLYKYAIYTLKSQEDALDAVSDTFVDIWKGIRSLRDPGSFGPWAFRILSLRCKNRIKEIMDKRNTLDIEELLETPKDTEEAVDVRVSEYTALYNALEALSDEDREIIILSVLHGYSNKEIAEMLSMPSGTVSSKLARSYEKLRKKLGGDI